MRGPEAAFWNHIRTRMRGRWVATRIENAVGVGDPDVTFSAEGRDGWIELKALEREPPRVINLPRTNHLTSDQVTWIEEHGGAGAGLVWMVVRLGDRVVGVEHGLVRSWMTPFPTKDLVDRVSWIMPYPISPDRFLRNILNWNNRA